MTWVSDNLKIDHNLRYTYYVIKQRNTQSWLMAFVTITLLNNAEVVPSAAAKQCGDVTNFAADIVSNSLSL
jgi:hypothetical protein